MSITAGLAATKAALDITKIIMDKLNTPDVDAHVIRGSVAELLIHVVNAQVALGDARGEILGLQQQIADRELLKATEADLEYQKGGGYYLRKSDGAICCPVCWGDQQKSVPMVPAYNGSYFCSIHKSTYSVGPSQQRGTSNLMR